MQKALHGSRPKLMTSILKTFRGSRSLENQEKTKLHFKSISGAFRKSMFGAFLKGMAFWKSVLVAFLCYHSLGLTEC